MFLENAKGRFVLSDSPMLKVGKVIAVRRASHQVDVMFLTGEVITAIPVLCGFGGSNFGVTPLAAPTINTSLAVQNDDNNYSSTNLPTYSPSSSTADTAPTSTESTNLTYPPLQSDQQLFSGGANRDTYAAVLPIEGDRMGITGMVVIGFLYPPDVEMMFDSNSVAPNAFSDFFLFRHPSDVQVTVDRNGFTSIQHPSGARITLGDMNAVEGHVAKVPYTPPASPDIDSQVDLTAKDLNGYYKLRANQGQKPGAIVEDAAQSQLRLDGRGDVKVKTANASIHIDSNGAITLTDAANNTVTMDGTSTITAKDAAGDTITMANGAINLTATVEANVNAPLIYVNGDQVFVGPATAFAADGPTPIARVGDLVQTPAGLGVIVTGSAYDYAPGGAGVSTAPANNG